MCWWCNTQWKPGTTQRESPCLLLRLHGWTNSGTFFLFTLCVCTNPLSFRRDTWLRKETWRNMINSHKWGMSSHSTEKKGHETDSVIMSAFSSYLPVTLFPEQWSQGYSLPSAGAWDKNSLSSPWRLFGGRTPEGVMLGLSPFVVATGRLQPQHCSTKLWCHSTACHCSWARTHCMLIPTVKRRWVIHLQLRFPKVIFTN